MMKLASSCATALVVLAAGVPGPLRAEEVSTLGLKAEVIGPVQVAEPRRQPKWGAASTEVRTLHGLGFQVSDSSTTFYSSPLNGHRYRTGGDSLWFDAELPDLPAGALLVGMELEGCDTNATGHVAVGFFRHTSPTGSTGVVGILDTGDTATPGCAFFGGPDNLPAGQVVDNVSYRYSIRVELTATDPSTSLGAVRVYYRRQVSPAPAVASFPSDVPVGHPFFQFVEALASSGVTAGCGAGSYCPDSPVTRGQMAVFLAVALGLHFPN